ncbi:MULTISPECIES: bestrophin family protein [Providencia]|uniref:bestrophin family protein n=1 Tax=Providencia TaxID=586 RepID=UPI000D7E8D54|nr:MULTISPECIES: bestrophin family ion channel [Providencia]AWS52328.1 ibestrophin [Providencia rettgeri]MCG5290779.1 ibestrophin [Providencia rettgeri]MCL0020972.1 ibestrophin [Providencia rettgeri]QZY65692.1 ibestrophin [Providencia rettgeri]WOB83276.1 bestrophin family ion channel [Providencia sp. PROV114]
MVIRPHQHWFFRLFDWHGSVLSKITFRLSLNIMISIVAVLSFQWYERLGIHLTIAPFSLLGIAIAIFLGFRNNACYSRLIEARTLWASLLINQRNILRNIKGLLPNDQLAQKEFANLLIAFGWSLKHELRKTSPIIDLYRLLPRNIFDEVIRSPFSTSRILLQIGLKVGELRDKKVISDVLFQAINKDINALSDVLGGCERISNTPIPFAYTLILQRTVYLFCSLLPFALVVDLHFMTPFVSVFISYTFLAWDALAEELEDPFGIAANDLPLNAICNSIERNALDMLDIQPLPPQYQPDKYFNLL